MMKFHDNLNEKLWNGWELKPEVADKLEQITELFIEYLDIPVDAVKDVRITGSSANYNYTPHSDLDLHLVIDYDRLHKDCPLVEGYLWGYKQAFNTEHDIKLYGVPVEVYAEDSNTPAVSNGVFSLMNNEWIKKPEKIPPTDNDAAVQSKFTELKDACDKCDDSEEAQKLLDKIYAMRKAGLAEEGEVSTENLAFKKLRDNGCLDKLRDIKKDNIDKNLSLEHYIYTIHKHSINLNEQDVQMYLTGPNKSIIRNFIELHNNLISDSPVEYNGERDIEDILYFLGSKDGIQAKIKTPIETITFNSRNLNHLLFDNEKQRLRELGKIRETLKQPNLIIETNEGSCKHNYIKAFKSNDLPNTQLVVVKLASDGIFYVTTFRLRDRKFQQKLKEGQIIYDLSDTYAAKSNDLSYNNSIHTNNKNVKEHFTIPQLLTQLRKFYEGIS